MTFNIFSIALSPFHAGCSFGSWLVTTLLIGKLEGERMAQTRLVNIPHDGVVPRPRERLSALALLRDVGIFNVRVRQRERELAKHAVTSQQGSSANETSGNKCRYPRIASKQGSSAWTQFCGGASPASVRIRRPSSSHT
jgi:hypothetical protein